MARGEWLSVLGLYRYDNSLFDNLVIPEVIDRDTLINNILLECAELEVIYPNFDILKEAIGYWSKKRLDAWKRIANVLYEDYDPFINIKRDEERTITETRDLANSLNSNVNVSSTDTVNSTVVDDGTIDNTLNINAWDDDSEDGVQRETTSNSNHNSSVTGGTSTNNGDTTRTDTGTDTGTITTHETFHVEGDSAITDAQDVAMKEFKLRDEYNLYDYIIKDFIDRFCLLVY